MTLTSDSMPVHWNEPAVQLFELFFRPWMHRRLDGIYITGLPADLPPDRAVLLAANHVSWWDAFLLREVHRHGGGRQPLLTLMDARELRRFPFFRRMGVVGLSPAPGAVRGALRQVASMRAGGPVWLSVFPQGRIWPSWRRPPAFRKGVTRFAEVLSPAVVLPVGLHLEPLAWAAPSAFVAVGRPVPVYDGMPLSLAVLEERVTLALAFIHRQLAQYGESAPQHWPGLYDSLQLPPASITDPSTTQLFFS